MTSKPYEPGRAQDVDRPDINPVWVLDDEPGMRWVLQKALVRAGWPVVCFASGEELLAVLKQLRGPADPQAPAVLVSDVRMAPPDGMTVLRAVHERLPDLPVIMMTAFSDLETTVAAFERGAFEYLVKPFDIASAVDLIGRAARLRDTAAQTPEPMPALHEPPSLVPSRSPKMQEIFRAIGRLASTSATVLITGESGTGKELVAHALHLNSRRASGPFVAVNAAAIPRDLLEAELFGHERGAFTGAVQPRRGRFEQADGGTLFLDEIGDMPAELQTRLLRVLAESNFYRVGGTRPVQVDVRIVAATNQPLESRVRTGEFRADLYHRLNVIRLRLPPLRERREDIEPLANHFLAHYAAHLHVALRRLDPRALARLQQFDYPGNIRQLENICQWLTVMSPTVVVEPEDLPAELLRAQSTEGASAPGWRAALAAEVRERLEGGESALFDQLQRDFEQLVLDAALQFTHGQRGAAARCLGIGRNTFTRRYREPDPAQRLPSMPKSGRGNPDPV